VRLDCSRRISKLQVILLGTRMDEPPWLQKGLQGSRTSFTILQGKPFILMSSGRTVLCRTNFYKSGVSLHVFR
jgi:hypothetical protein